MSNALCDLHLHTHYSDGKASPAELLHYAAEIGLKTVSITDHDNCNAAQEAANVSLELGLELVSGVEITTRWQSCLTKFEYGGQTDDVDLLGYFMDSSNTEFMQFLKNCMNDYSQRLDDCCNRLTKSGFPITIYDVLDENPRCPSPISLLTGLIHTQNANNLPEAYALFIQHWPEVQPCACTIFQAIQAIHQAGGAAVLAHPIAVNCGAGWISAEQLKPLVDAGLDGLEIAHPRMDDDARRHFLALAKRYQLVITGGSDEHGESPCFSRIGSQIVTYDMVYSLQQRALSYQILNQS